MQNSYKALYLCTEIKIMDNCQHYTLDYILANGDKKLKAKKSYNNEKDAITAAMKINCKESSIHKIVAYKCNVCGKWHLGHNRTILSLSDKEKIKEKLSFIEKWERKRV